MEQPSDSSLARALQCGRRMFLAALILGSKYLQDRNYSARAWSKISGLQVSEINLNERAFLAAVKWELHIPEATFNRWQDILIKYSHPVMTEAWKCAIRHLCPETIAKSQMSMSSCSPQELFRSVDWRRSQPEVAQSPRSPMDVRSWGALSLSSASSSPQILEPRAFMQPPPAPAALKLPTPSPMASLCSTPAASCANDMLKQASRSRAMCFAMSTANSAATARSCFDLAPTAQGLNGAQGSFSRRSSLASSIGKPAMNEYSSPSTTSSPKSSPGSMISDHSSRSSSVCSISSAQNTSPVRNHLSRLATINAAYKLADSAAATIPTCDDDVVILGSAPLSSGQLTSSPEVIVIEDETTPTQPCFDSARDSRKRYRSSFDSVAPSNGTDLYDQVRLITRRDMQSRLNGMENSTMSHRRAVKKQRSMAQAPDQQSMMVPLGTRSLSFNALA